MRIVSPPATRQAEPDQACAEAVDLARLAAVQDAGASQVGEHVGIEVEGDRVVTHLFNCLSPAYVGWRWAVTVARASRSKVVTVSESVLLPGPDSLLAPEWVPWTSRIRPGDLKAGDLMPASPDDERLVPLVALSGDSGLLDWDQSGAWTQGLELRAADLATAELVASDAADTELPDAQLADELAEAELAEAELAEAELAEAELAEAELANAELANAEVTGNEVADVVAELEADADEVQAERPVRVRRRLEGPARPRRVLSSIGRDEAASRWHAGEHGPRSPLASAAPACCVTCGFMVRLNGPLGRVFGVCANEFAPDDGKVVSVDHGCGAHSEGDVVSAGDGDTIPTVDELGYDMLNTGASVPDSVLENLDHELL
jgi:hypothetical protein